MRVCTGPYTFSPGKWLQLYHCLCRGAPADHAWDPACEVRYCIKSIEVADMVSLINDGEWKLGVVGLLPCCRHQHKQEWRPCFPDD